MGRLAPADFKNAIALCFFGPVQTVTVTRLGVLIKRYYFSRVSVSAKISISSGLALPCTVSTEQSA
ncbi:MAG: hypothetical protein HC886_15900 [Leptolyngbyaceae cyanobacterium SM1_1_3]|nr:hypothetical protein [Leptolyngbyaceae cyanobacterium SM1_1_3]